MRLFDSILLSLSVGFFIIGVHQVMTLGITYAYWILMMSMVLLLWYKIRKKKAQQQATITKDHHPKKKRKHSK